MRLVNPGGGLTTAGFALIPPPGSPNIPPPGFDFGTVDSTDQFDATRYPLLPCFLAGTPIDTPRGIVLVERLRAGDAVLTHDGGVQRVAWAGGTTIERALARRQMCYWPVRFPAGALGNHAPVLVSPQHRMHLQGFALEMLCGMTDALAPAIGFCGLGSVRQVEPPGDLSYHHVAFDTHALIRSNGLVSESLYLPQDETDPQHALRRSLSVSSDTGHPELAFPQLRKHETRLVFDRMLGTRRAA